MKKSLFIVLGTLCVILGIIGIFVPVLPTTPFLLLAAALYAKSSQKLYDRLLNHKLFGKIIRDYREDKSISVKSKIVAISTMWLLMLFSIFFVINEKWYLQVLLGGIAVGVTIHILSFKTKKGKGKLVKD